VSKKTDEPSSSRTTVGIFSTPPSEVSRVIVDPQIYYSNARSRGHHLPKLHHRRHPLCHRRSRKRVRQRSQQNHAPPKPTHPRPRNRLHLRPLRSQPHRHPIAPLTLQPASKIPNQRTPQTRKIPSRHPSRHYPRQRKTTNTRHLNLYI